MKKFKLLIFTLLLFMPTLLSAKSSYIDKVYDIVGEEKTDNLTIYLFHQESCPHCRKEMAFLDELEEEYKDKITVRRYEVTGSKKNAEYMDLVKERFEKHDPYVPFTVIGDETFTGFGDSRKEEIRSIIDNYLKENKDTEKTFSLPLLGKVSAKDVSIPLVAVVLGLIDGFNPCAMWVLLFLINMLFNMQDKKRMWLIGFTFLFTSAFVYFLAMLGLSVVLSFTAVIWVRRIIALVALIGGILNIKSYIETPKDGCTVVDSKKRKKYFTRIDKFTKEKSIIFALIGVIALAISVNMVELACSAGFPSIFVSIMDLNNVSLVKEILYILLYVFFYLIDDLVVFIVAMVSLKLSGITTKYNRLCHLVGGIIMILIGLLLIFKPEWIMLNF